ncbi:hypothetical protein VARIO8X_160034 [Burkholderiales bacterium 8X]|nr:hypothetical protein VARIO8X_160034 [Burkholderiales bacterium 8X]
MVGRGLLHRLQDRRPDHRAARDRRRRARRPRHLGARRDGVQPLRTVAKIARIERYDIPVSFSSDVRPASASARAGLLFSEGRRVSMYWTQRRQSELVPGARY